MERFDSYDKNARPLTRNELDHIDATLLLPASNRCGIGRFESGKYVLHKDGDRPIRVYNGVDFYPKFYSKVDSRANTWEYFVGMEALESLTFDELSPYERECLKKVYRRQYLAEGGELTELSDDDEWQSLVRPEEFENVDIYIQTTTGYVFGSRGATRKYEVSRDVEIGREAKSRQLGSLSISSALGDWTLRRKKDFMSCEDATILDMSAEDYTDITLNDVDEAVEILRVLDLVTPSDHARYVNEIRL